jgi:hypothetical protein
MYKVWKEYKAVNNLLALINLFADMIRVKYLMKEYACI